MDDIEDLADIPSAEVFLGGKVPVAKTFGDFLRDFDEAKIQGLNHFLTSMGHEIRKHLKLALPEEYAPKEKPHFSVDSTFHEQHGNKIEGCAFNYESRWGLNSEVVFDEMGIAYAGILESGNTKPGTDGPKLLEQVLLPLRGEKLKVPSAKVAHVSGDSAYGYEEFIRVCQAQGASFTIAARKNIPWFDQIEKFVDSDWTEWKYSAKDFDKWTKKKKSPPLRFLSRWHWQPSWAPQLMFLILTKKEWKADDEFTDSGSWHYHAVITNEDLTRHSYQEIFERYLVRSDMENFIKEAKMNFDAYHLPCLKFNANHAFLLLLLIAFNILRWVSLVHKLDKPFYAKKLRKKFIFQAAKFVSHAKQLWLKVSKKFKEEVDRFKEAWGLQPAIVSPRCSSA